MANVASPVGSGLVVAQFLAATGDSIDSDSLPDAEAVTGIITFTPSEPLIRVPNMTGVPNAQTILLDTIIGVLDSSGYLCRNYVDPVSGTYVRGVPLVATDIPNVSPEGWVWKVSYSLQFRGKSIAGPVAHPLQLEPGSTTDLTLAAPVAESGGIITIAGPSNTLSIGTVTTAPTGSATITGTSPTQTLNLVLPEFSAEQKAYAIAMAIAL